MFNEIKTIKKIDKNIDTHLNEIKFFFLKGFSIKKYDNKLNNIVMHSSSNLSKSLRYFALFLAKANIGKCHK